MTQHLDRLQDIKVLMYSHDSFGLGHLRRCRAIAHSLVDAYKGISILILSGSPIIGRFDFKARVEFICIPGVVKLRNGDYTSLGLHIDIDKTLAMRASVIQHTAEVYAPDIFIVDKEPLGLRGEVEQTLKLLKLRGTINVLGLRDVMDDSEMLQAEWQRKEVVPALDKLYDEIWIYGSESIINPIQGIELPRSTRDKMRYLGYLKRELPATSYLPREYRKEPYLLITTGGGGDGEQLVDWVVRAYEEAGHNEIVSGLVVLGPFMSKSAQRGFRKRIRKIPGLQATTFDSSIEVLMVNSVGIVAMGGYNTFCEILSFDKPAIIVPRESPRLEQRIRADFASSQGLVKMLKYSDFANTGMMIQALKMLPEQQLPSTSGARKLLNGLENFNRRIAELMLDH
jgi:predicted glycosyltransferase